MEREYSEDHKISEIVEFFNRNNSLNADNNKNLFSTDEDNASVENLIINASDIYQQRPKRDNKTEISSYMKKYLEYEANKYTGLKKIYLFFNGESGLMKTEI